MVILFGSCDQPFITLLIDNPVILCLISNYSGVCAWECLSYLISRLRHFFVPKYHPNLRQGVPPTLLSIPGLPPLVVPRVPSCY